MMGAVLAAAGAALFTWTLMTPGMQLLPALVSGFIFMAGVTYEGRS